jgi:hypothetical protein
VTDPEGYQTELMTDLRLKEDQLDLWLVQGAERFRRDVPLSEALLNLARHKNSRKCLLVLNLILDTPELLDRLWNALQPDEEGGTVRHEKQ